MVKAIDVHCHMVLPCYLEGLKEMNVDPVAEDGFPVPSWSEEEHLKFMEEAGITTSILSLSSPHIHFGDSVAACKLARQINEETATICNRYPGKMKYAAVLPLPEIEGSINEIKYNYDELGAVAVKAASNNHGVYLGDPVLDPVFEELDKRKAVLIIHPTRPSAVPAGVFTEKVIPLFEFIGDTTRAVLNLIVNGTLEKFPNVKVIVPHCGSFLPLLSHRLSFTSQILSKKGMMKEVDVDASIKRLYFDIAGTPLPVALDALMKITNPSHILYGSDYPYTPVKIIEQIKAGVEDYAPVKSYLQDILYNNAQKLLSL